MSSMTQKAEGEWEWNDDDEGEITDEESDVDEELELEAGENGNNKTLPPQTTAGSGGPNGGNVVGLSPPLLRPPSFPTPLPPPIRPPFPSNSNSNHRPLRRSSPFNLCAPSTFLLLIPAFLFIILLAQYSPQTPVGGVFGLPGLLRSSQSALEKMTVQVGAPQRTLRVMSFNIWVSGANVENGMVKIASQIKQADPDIVALQEVRTAEVARNLTQLLGSSVWKCAFHPFAPYPDVAILTKHKFVLENEFVHLQFERNISDFIFNEEHYENNSVVTYGIGATIQLEPDGQLVNFYSMHLDWRSYGPYAANNKQVTRAEQIMIGERNKEGYGRAQNIEQLLGNEEFQKHKELAGKQPLIVAGDFNAPSHLDWIEETKELHGGWAFEWPATKLMMDAGFLDSFRKIHPDVVKEPGTTWSTVQKEVGPEWDWEIPEPQDRIDFIFYVPSASFRPTESRTYAGYAPLKPIPNQAKNEWPSDHFSVISEFQIDLAIQEGKSREFEFSTQQTNSTAAGEMEGKNDEGMVDRAE